MVTRIQRQGYRNNMSVSIIVNGTFKQTLRDQWKDMFTGGWGEPAVGNKQTHHTKYRTNKNRDARFRKERI